MQLKYQQVSCDHIQSQCLFFRRPARVTSTEGLYSKCVKEGRIQHSRPKKWQYKKRRRRGLGYFCVKSAKIDHSLSLCKLRLDIFLCFSLHLSHLLLTAMSLLKFEVALEQELHLLWRQAQLRAAIEDISGKRHRQQENISISQDNANTARTSCSLKIQAELLTTNQNARSQNTLWSHWFSGKSMPLIMQREFRFACRSTIDVGRNLFVRDGTAKGIISSNGHSHSGKEVQS